MKAFVISVAVSVGDNVWYIDPKTKKATNGTIENFDVAVYEDFMVVTYRVNGDYIYDRSHEKEPILFFETKEALLDYVSGGE